MTSVLSDSGQEALQATVLVGRNSGAALFVEFPFHSRTHITLGKRTNVKEQSKFT